MLECHMQPKLYHYTTPILFHILVLSCFDKHFSWPFLISLEFKYKELLNDVTAKAFSQFVWHDPLRVLLLPLDWVLVWTPFRP